VADYARFQQRLAKRISTVVVSPSKEGLDAATEARLKDLIREELITHARGIVRHVLLDVVDKMLSNQLAEVQQELDLMCRNLAPSGKGERLIATRRAWAAARKAERRKK
jgi:hypothetical protein